MSDRWKASVPVRSIVIAPGRIEPVDNPLWTQSLDSPDSPGRWLVLATLFLVTGALGLSLLWRCRDFSTPERWFWAVIVTLYTAGLFVAVGLVINWSRTSVLG